MAPEEVPDVPLAPDEVLVRVYWQEGDGSWVAVVRQPGEAIDERRRIEEPK